MCCDPNLGLMTKVRARQKGNMLKQAKAKKNKKKKA
jgi:hypothetical protein